jgi:myo-inositol-1(or 4)-monophosphatase
MGRSYSLALSPETECAGLSLQEFQQTAEEAARRAGEVLQSWAKRFTVREKSRSNLVTEADLAAQDTIYELIRGRYPDHNFLGEENLSRTDGLSPYRWVIDPLDGTSNYVHGFPYYAVSIGLEKNGELVAGVIFDPNRDEMFSATRGCGATLNGEAIQPSTAEDLSQAMLVASLPVATTSDNPAVRKFLKVIPLAQTVQRTGSAALNLAYVAAGRIDGFWSSSLKPWDMAGGALIVSEAGGRISRIDGRPLQIEIPDLLATNGTALHEQLSGLLRDESDSSKT